MSYCIVVSINLTSSVGQDHRDRSRNPNERGSIKTVIVSIQSHRSVQLQTNCSKSSHHSNYFLLEITDLDK